MKANEFRIGNWVYQNGELTEIVSIDRGSKTLYRINDILINKVTLLSKNTNKTIFEPVQITEERLLKFGFSKEFGERWCERHEQMEEVSKFYKGSFCIYYNTELDKYMDDSLEDYKLKLEYVHQLQNVYFALSDEELVAK